MKLIIQIPCYNEEETIPVTLGALPKKLKGVDTIEWMIIDDGSRDNTIPVARQAGAHHVVRHIRNLGLARAFMTGLDACLNLGADIIVNTDADNQYCADDIQKLIEPILSGRAEIVIGERPISQTSHFSFTKKLLQRLGSYVVRVASGTDIPDAPSGFRAISRDAARHLRVFNEYTYTLETIIQAGQKGIAITSVPVRTNGDLRPSRLVKSIGAYVRRSLTTILRIFMTYRPLKFFSVLGMILFIPGLLISLRFLYFFLSFGEAGHVQSLILSSLLMGGGFFLFIIGLISDLIASNRKLLEEMSYRLRKIEERLNGHDKKTRPIK
jgi:glycosyltransferase involved in cell wall biosynthesis